MNLARSSPRVLFLGFLLLFSGGAARAQTTGDIVGTVTDASGGVLSGVTIVASSSSLQGTRLAVTARDGTYRIPAVPPGAYRVEAAASDFATVEMTTIVSLGTTATVNVTLTLSREEKVVVSGEAPRVDTASTEGGTHYGADVISRLPLARNYADIVRSNPGVQQDRGMTQGRTLALTIYGSSSVENQWNIDGINTTNVQKGFQGKVLNVESIEEVEVKTGGYQAEYGRAIGGVINVITKSGGNLFHGDGFLYYDSLDTVARPIGTDRDLPLQGMRVTGYTRTDFGADLGGFLLRDRLWFFGAYDRVELPAKVARYQSTALVPSTMEFPVDGVENIYSGKLTWNAATGTTLVATAFGDPAVNSGAGWADPRQGQVVANPVSNPDPARWLTTRSFGGLDAGLRWNQLFGSSAMMTLQASQHHDRYELEASGIALALPQYLDYRCVGGTPEKQCRFPFPIITGGIGPLGGPDDRAESKRDQYRGDLSVFRGNHEIKLGGDYLSASTRVVEAYSGGQRVSIQNEHGFLYYRHFFIAKSPTDLTPVDSVLRPKTMDYGGYVQDSWRIGPGWTVNAGLRWDGQDVRDYRDVTVIRTRDAWQPRLGVVWDPTRDGKMKIYAFAGRFSYALPTDLSTRAFGDYTAANTYNFDPISVVQDPNVPGRERALIAGGAFSTPIDSGLSGIHQDEYTVALERILTPGFSIALKGTYRRLGRAIEERCDLDYSRPETDYNTCGIMNPGSKGGIAHGNFPGCNGLDYPYYECTDTIPATPSARRLYRGVEILVRKSAGEKLWLQASYLYSSLRGNYNGGVTDFGQTTPGGSGDFDYPAFYHNRYGRLFLDRPHSLRFDGIYVTPLKLRVGLQAYFQSGAPLDRIGFLSYYYGSAVQLDQKGYAGRMPSLWEANLTLSYPIVIGPATVTVQAYVYNLFNNQFPTYRDTVWSDDEPAGYPASIFDPAQQQTNPYYGRATSRQDPRMLRAAVKISF
jgi:hypothetical protein